MNGTQIKIPMIDSKTVANELIEIGIKPSLKGYSYLKEALVRCYEDGSYLCGITKRLYPELAKFFNTTASKVERAMRHAIERAWDAGDFRKQAYIFGGTIDINRGRPTNKEFLATIVEHLQSSAD